MKLALKTWTGWTLAFWLTLAGVLSAQGTTVSVGALRDNTLYFDPNGGLSNGAGIYCFAGTNLVGQARRALLAFDIASAVPSNATITSAELQLHMSQTIAGPVAVSMHRVLESWGEGSSYASDGQGGGAPATAMDATWIHRSFPAAPWSTPGGDYDPAASATIMVDDSGGYLFGTTSALVADVQSFLANPTQNFGWLLRTDETTSPTAKRFATKEHPTPSSRPTLIVTFSIPAASVQSTGVGCTGTSPLPYSMLANGLPSLGNSGFSIDLSQGPPNQLAFSFLAADVSAAPTLLSPNCAIWLDLTSALSLVASGASPHGPHLLSAMGSVVIPVPIPSDPLLAGFTISLQSAAQDSLAPAGFVLSNALKLTVY